ncbi:MAG: TonB-dependent receptor [Ideonella sp.]|nr:TonB-dependent receptor [Ideonella sp.]
MNQGLPRCECPLGSLAAVRVLRPLLFGAALAAVYPAHAAQPADLTSLSLESLMELTVVGASKYEQKQSEVAAAVSVVTRGEIKAFGWRTLAQALASLPGVHTTYDRQYTYLGTRGFGLPGDLTARLLITINGNRVNDPVYDGGPAGREFPLDLDLVERIEFIPGPGGAVYGQNAMFGVVNVITRIGDDVGGTELALATQQPQRLRDGRASWGSKLDNGIDMLVSASVLRARGSDHNMDFGTAGVAGRAVGLDGERLTQIFGRVARSAWSFDFVHGDRRKSDPTAAFFSDPLVPGQFNRDAYTLAQFHFKSSFASDTLELSGRMFAGRYRYDSAFVYSGSWTTSPAQGDWQGTELRLLSTAVADHKLMLGLEAQNNLRTDQALLDRTDPANDVRIPGSGHRIGLYLQDEWRITPALSATLGLRADRNKTTGTSTSPRAALIWQASPGTTLKALYGRAHRAPNAYERDYDDTYSQVANPALKGERIDTMELVADHRVGTDLNLRGTVYQWTMHDIVVLGIDAVSGLTQYQSGQTVKARGLELSADKTWGLGARLRGSMSFQDVAYAGGGGLPNSPKLLAKLNLSAPLPWAGLRAGYELRRDSRRLSLDGTRLGGYAVSNLHLSTEALAKGLELSLNISNLFDKRYSQPAADSNWQNALEQDGRSIAARVSYRF